MKKPKLETLKQLVEFLRGIPMFKGVIELMDSKSFTDFEPHAPEDYTVIGVMSPLERACVMILEADKVVGCSDCFQRFIDTIIKARLGLNHESSVNWGYSGFQLATMDNVKSPATMESFDDIEKLSTEEMLWVSIQNVDFMGRMLKLLGNKKFRDSIDPMPKKAIFIAEMNDGQKALFTIMEDIINAVATKEEKMVEIMMGDSFRDENFCLGATMISFGSFMMMIHSAEEPKRIPIDPDGADAKTVDGLRNEISQLEQVGDSVYLIYLGSLQATFAEKFKGDPSPYQGMIICQGFTIALIPK